MLAGKVALVTGAGQGVGRGIALALAERGATVAVAGRTLSKVEAVAAEITEAGGTARAFACDVKDAASLDKLAADTAAALGGIAILVNNAQEVPLGPILSVSDEAFEAGFVSGPLATVRLMRACHPHLKAAGDGVIVNLSSSATRRWDMAGYGHYGAVKRGIESLTRAAAAEWGPDGIRVLAIAPHADSPGLKAWIAARPAEAEAFFQTIPLRRIGTCEADIGRAVAAMCGPDFAYLTGAIVPLDGGQANFA
ncbi:SDR family NAD(P)-dependent oxidoreductase [Sphingomonas jatrophae]|uniref:NAD(P)-dependent dehydrogenase, short-chain alcohol dehydrogenase family n=1 Tax=Sphingomonas jatrophae TaxID=1166337 RepID=A0A1I6KJD2_9SPHN|nr:SDR family oxidoreductase [Sphingomonas jatrophae]SFR90970.1 NAD(P)-dependent dehydrogenase, short-chain alcohol dehydrogenase family [Sphingomonas jatrophae]